MRLRVIPTQAQVVAQNPGSGLNSRGRLLARTEASLDGIMKTLKLIRTRSHPVHGDWQRRAPERCSHRVGWRIFEGSMVLVGAIQDSEPCN